LDPIEEITRSRYARRLLAARPELAAEADASAPPFARAEMATALAGADADDLAALQARLRRLRQRVLLRVMARDLSGRASLDEVCGTMSDLAECAIAACLRFARCEDLAVIGMGKLGGRELNVSSDIDLVFVHPGEADAGERYERAGRALIRLLSETTADGFAFRVDMRLRPYGDAGPLACNLEFLEHYFVTQGREWERYAWIKARALTGTLGEALERTVRPFVFRKYLDYATLTAMRRLHAEVRREVERRELAGNVKLGPGGIREIEFVAQALQLIRGGRDAELTVKPTLAVLSLLSQKKLLPEKAALELSEAYVFLRHVEHRLQYLDDAQRHELPAEGEDCELLAAMCGQPSWAAFSEKLQAHRAAVTRHFQAVFAEERQAAAEPWPEHPRLSAMRASQRYAALPEDSRRRLDAVVPALARAAAATADPQETIARGADLLEAVASRAAYLALLAENPAALARVARIIGASSWAAAFVTRHPLLLDELLDDRVLYAPIDLSFFSKNLRSQLAAHPGDTERQMNDLREQHQGQVFRLLAQDLAGLLTVERLADHLSALADLVLGEVLRVVWQDLRVRHREEPAFAVIAYGKLGGKELGYASDLDIIFLYDDADERAPEAYARLAQRMNHWLTTHTSAGVLFDTDLRLRPSGAAGLMVSSVEAFERYQEKDAWVWEHQALTRARYCAGDAKVGEKFEAIRERILKRKRDGSGLAGEILAMREKMHAAHPNKSDLFDVKHDRGGMIDVEFAVQYLVLAHAHDFSSLTKNLGNIALLGMAAQLGLIPPDLAERCREAYRELRRLQHGLRLSGARYARVPPEAVASFAAAVRELWASLIGTT
jgi:glutamate-ammonia-ligase adenylyltransferase